MYDAIVGLECLRAEPPCSLASISLHYRPNLSKPLLCSRMALELPLESTELTGIWPTLKLLNREHMLVILVRIADVEYILHSRAPIARNSNTILLTIS